MAKSRKTGSGSEIDEKTGKPVAESNAYRTLAAIIRLLGIYVAFEPYKSIGTYVGRFTFTGNHATGGFSDVLAALESIGFTRTSDVQTYATDRDDSLGAYAPTIPAHYVALSGSATGRHAGFAITLHGSDNPENGLIPFFTIDHYPESATVPPKQSDKSKRPVLKIAFKPATLKS